MEFKQTALNGVTQIIPKRFEDERGFFFESYNKKLFEENGIDCSFVQDNHVRSFPGVIRGLHFQRSPYAQAKLIRVGRGKILDVAVDLRKDSPTFGQSVCEVLSAEKGNMLFIPEGFAHGYCSLEESDVFYKVSNIYHPASEGGVLWNDATLKIEWPEIGAILSVKDQALPPLKELLASQNSLI